MRDNAFDMKRFVYIFLLAAVLGVWMPGAGAHVSEDWRSESVMSVIDFQQIDAELGTQKTLVPGLESKWIICRNNPVNRLDPDGRWDESIHLGGGEYGGTLQWAQDAGMSPDEATVLAVACNATDQGSTGYMPYQDQSRHFNTIIGAESGGPNDSRIINAENHMQRAIEFEQTAQLIEETLGSEAAAGLHEIALQELGMGLHSLQDVDAHVDTAVMKVGDVYHHIGNGWCDDPGPAKIPTQAYLNTKQRSTEYITIFQEAAQ